jgi:hypothetical protein
MKETISGIIALLAFASPFIALVVIIAVKVYKKFLPSPPMIQAKQQPGGWLDEQSSAHQPVSPQRAIAEFIATSLLVVLSGALAGILASIFSHLVYIVFIFPLAMGFLGGNVVTGAIQMAKIRKSSQVIFLSLLAAITIYGTYHYGKYVALQLQTSLELFPGLSQATEDKNLSAAKAFVDYALEKETGSSGFVGYVLFKASQGVSIGRAYQSNPSNLGPILTWFYWLLEFGIIMVVTLIMGRQRIKRPVCQFCGNGLGRETHLGGTDSSNESFLLDLIQQKDFIELGKLIEENAELPSLEIYIQGCNVCHKSNSDLVVRRVFQGRKGGLQFTDASKTVLQPQESVHLLSQLKFLGN